MQQRAFFYDLASEGWKECMDPNYVMSDMALVPVHQVVLRKKSISAPAQQEVWCAKHHAYELVDKLGERELTTREGCQMQGLLQGGFHWKGDDCSKISVSPIRWRVLYYEDIGAVALIQDIPEIWWGRNTDTRTNEVVWVPDLRGFRTEEVTFRFREERIYREKHCQDIPDCVADAALAAGGHALAAPGPHNAGVQMVGISPAQVANPEPALGVGREQQQWWQD